MQLERFVKEQGKAGERTSNHTAIRGENRDGFKFNKTGSVFFEPSIYVRGI
jgi:hypothetical protein